MLGARVERLVFRVSPAWRQFGSAALGVIAAAAVGFAAAGNDAASPAHEAVLVRVTIIAILVLAGLYVQRSEIDARMGGLLVAVGLYSSLWLLNGSSHDLLFSVGVLCTGAMPALAAGLLLAHPTGRLGSRTERRFLWIAGGATTAIWIAMVALTPQPPLHPLVDCAPNCPANVFSVASDPGAVDVLKAAMATALIVLLCGTSVLLRRRARSASVPMRRSLTPVRLAATTAPVLLVAYLLLSLAGRHLGTPAGAAYLAVSVSIPLAIIVGLSRERLFMGQALADFVNQLARAPNANPEALMAAALRDPSLKIRYRRPGLATYVDSAGTPVDDLPGESAVTWIERDHEPVAAVMYSSDLSDQERFVQAAGAAALCQLEKAQLEADLKASTGDFAASRTRLMRMAHADRRRLEQDLHDGVQQHLVGLRIKLDMAAETVKEDPAEGERALAWVGREMDDVLQELRSLARGIYPTLLREHGLREALKSAARISPIPIKVRVGKIERYSGDVEIAVYFCCLEALQNVVKHAGPNATATVDAWRTDSRLEFMVRNPGIGFDADQVCAGSGLVNMRDRIESVNGTLRVISGRGRGVSVRGSVPVA
jgi:signal transduction histidine kinase